MDSLKAYSLAHKHNMWLNYIISKIVRYSKCFKAPLNGKTLIRTTQLGDSRTL